MNPYFRQPNGTTNRLTRPIAIIGTRESYKRLCDVACLIPGNNDVFVHVEFVFDTEDAEYSRVLTVGNPDLIRDRLRIVSAARGRILNDRK